MKHDLALSPHGEMAGCVLSLIMLLGDLGIVGKRKVVRSALPSCAAQRPGQCREEKDGGEPPLFLCHSETQGVCGVERWHRVPSLPLLFCDLGYARRRKAALQTQLFPLTEKQLGTEYQRLAG